MFAALHFSNSIFFRIIVADMIYTLTNRRSFFTFYPELISPLPLHVFRKPCKFNILKIQIPNTRFYLPKWVATCFPLPQPPPPHPQAPNVTLAPKGKMMKCNTILGHVTASLYRKIRPC